MSSYKLSARIILISLSKEENVKNSLSCFIRLTMIKTATDANKGSKNIAKGIKMDKKF